MHGLRRVLEAVDNGIYQVERALLLVSLVLMTVLVFMDVCVRTFTRPVGKTAGLILWLLGDVAEETEKLIGETVGPAVFWVLLFGLCIFATHASRRIALERDPDAPAPKLGLSAAVGAGIFVAMFASLKLLLFVFPTSVDGAQNFALGFMVWTGFFGASIATRTGRHIAMDAVKKKLDETVYPWMSALGGAVTAAFTGYMAMLGFYKLWVEIEEWREVPGVGVFEAVPWVPTWLVTAAIPLALTMISLRFLTGGLSDLLYGSSLVAPADEISEELKRMEDGDDEDEAGPEPIHGLSYGVEHTGELGRPVEREEAS